ncbi:MAG: hypothetical protein RLZZ546_1173 [Bacteroidota bacterium]
MRQYLQLVLLFVFGLTGFAQVPVASYKFDGNVKDESSFANHASANAVSLTADRFGWANRAANFDGKQSAVTGQNAVQLNSPQATVSFWVKMTALPAQGEVYLLSFGGWQERFKISLPSHGKPVWTTNHSGGISDLDSGDGNVLKAGEWKHVTMVHDGALDIIYMNGVKVNEKAVIGTLNNTTKPLGIGHDPIDNANYANAAIDEVMLFNSALSAAEILALYTAQNTAPVIPVGLIANYKLNGNGNDNTSFANNAKSNASATTDRFGYGHAALSFDGESSELTASNASHMNSETVTVNFWIKVNSLPANGEAFIMSNGGWQERFKISLPTHGKPVWTTNHKNGISDMDSGDGNDLKVGKWTQVTMIHDGLKDKIYLDGVLKGSKDVVGLLNGTTKPFGLGYNAIDGGNWLDGNLDDVSIFNFAMNDAEVSALHLAESTFPGQASNLVASYALNGDGSDDSQFENDSHSDDAVYISNRHGWANNALQGSTTAANSMALQSDFTTISFWVKANSLPASGEVFLLSNGGWQERWKISLPSHGKPVFTTHPGFCCSDMDSGDGNALVVGTWKHVVMTHDGAKDIIYMDGVLVNEKAVVGALDKTKHPLGIGYDPIDNGSFFDGAIDDVQIYNNAMNATEVKALYDAQKTAPVVTDKLIASYAFSNDGVDATAYKNNASGAGASFSKDRFGKANKATSFNGKNAYMKAANSPQMNSNLLSVSFWAKVNTLPASGEVYLLSNGGWQERWKISLPSHGKPVFTTHAATCCNDLDSGDGNALPIGTWKHVVMTHDGVEDKIYMSGVLVNSKPYSGNLASTVHPLGIGYDPIDNGGFFDGSLDEVQLYSVALTAQEVLALYNLQNTPPADADEEAPTAPLNLEASVSFTNVNLSWSSSQDNVEVTAYNVYQDGNVIASTDHTDLDISGLKPLTDFVFGVSAIDDAGNESSVTTLKATSGQDETPDTTPPTVPGNLKGSAGFSSVILSWDASTDDRKLGGYIISVDGVYRDSVDASSTTLFVNNLDPETPYSFEVVAFDLSSNNSDAAELTISTTKPLDTGEDGLVAHYPFDGDAKDATPYLNHGAIGGNPTFEDPNHANGGGKNIKFDGSGDSVLVTNAVQLISEYTTVSFWIRVDGKNVADAEAYVIDFGHWDQRFKISLPQHLKIVWTTNGKNTQFPIFISDMDSGDGNEMVQGFWWYVTMVHDGEKDLIYVNGELTNSKPVATKLNSTARPLCFGSNPIEGGQYFIGALDNVKIYNKALSAAEIGKLFATGTTGVKDLAGLEKYNITAYPNPVSDFINVSHSLKGSNLQVRMSDALGRQLSSKTLSSSQINEGSFNLDLRTYSQGIYYLNFILDGTDFGSMKVVK